MAIQEKLANAFGGLKRKLFDHQIHLTGLEHTLVRLKVEVNKYRDEEITVLSHDLITVQIAIPGDIPLFRLRGASQDAIDTKTGIFLYDVIPMEAYAKFEDNIEKGDLLIRVVFDEKIETDPLVQVFRVSEVVGSMDTQLIHRKFLCAPYNMTLPDEAVSIIEENYT